MASHIFVIFLEYHFVVRKIPESYVRKKIILKATFFPKYISTDIYMICFQNISFLCPLNFKTWTCITSVKLHTKRESK